VEQIEGRLTITLLLLTTARFKYHYYHLGYIRSIESLIPSETKSCRNLTRPINVRTDSCHDFFDKSSKTGWLIKFINNNST
jgi:hypothetical protein